MIAISAGNSARKPKKATPAAMIGMLSAVFSAHDRLTICCQPRHGIWVGFSAPTPGSRSGPGTSGGSGGGGCSCRSPVIGPAGSVARPRAGELGEAVGPGPVDGGLRDGEDGALDG